MNEQRAAFLEILRDGALDLHKNGFIHPYIRQKIYTSFGEVFSDDHRKRRAYLDYITLIKLAEYDMGEFPDKLYVYERMHMVMHSIHDLIHGVRSKEDGWQQASDFQRELEDRYIDSAPDLEDMLDDHSLTGVIDDIGLVDSGCMLFAASNAIYVASGAFRFDIIIINEQTKDTDIYLWDRDTAAFAAAAIAGEEGQDIFQPHKCRVFWDWWLNSAIVDAWEQKPLNAL